MGSWSQSRRYREQVEMENNDSLFATPEKGQAEFVKYMGSEPHKRRSLLNCRGELTVPLITTRCQWLNESALLLSNDF